MGLFDRFAGKTPDPKPAPENTPAEATPAAAGGVMPRLVTAREKIEAKDLPAALAIYEEVLAVAGDRADVLVTISADLGINGHVREIVELVAPRYDAERHGPATGLNVLQAYLALRNTDAAQHVLDILFGLNRPELEERLHGFSNAIAEMILADQADPVIPGGTAEPAKINLVTISRPIWSYGLEAVTGLLPPKDGRARRVAFAQLALPGLPDHQAREKTPEEEMGRLSRALPLWFAELLYFCPHYNPLAAVGLWSQPGQPGHYALFPAEWTNDNLRQLVESTEGGLDYVFTGALRQHAGDYELLLRLWEVKKFRERKQFSLRWTPATADAELTKLHDYLRQFMEWQAYPADAGLVYAPAARPSAWLEVLGSSLTLFLGDKNLLAPEQLTAARDSLEAVAQHAASNEAASLAWVAQRARAGRLGFPPLGDAMMRRTPLVEQAQAAVAQG
jgi:hypothetical protein